MAPRIYTIDGEPVWYGSSYPWRIVIFTGAYNHIADGVSLTLNRLVSYLERHGMETLVVAPTIDDPPVNHSGTLVPVPSMPLPGRPEYRFSFGLTSSTRAAVRGFRPSLFHVATPDLLGYQTLRFAERLGIPVVASYHTHFSSYLKYYGFDALEPGMWKYLKNFYDRCHHVYVPSQSMVDVLRSHEITNGIRIWPRGVDTHRFNPSWRSASWRHALGVKGEDVLVSFIGRLVWEKGLGIFADVVEALRQRGVKHRCMVVGDGPALNELRKRLPGGIFTGYLKGRDLSRAYASSDLFLFPSDTETFGNVTLEAMASGLPTVCADATGSRTLVEDARTGRLVPPGDTHGFVDAVRYLIEHTPERRNMGRAAHRRARGYDWDTVLSHMVGYYDELLDRKGFRARPVRADCDHGTPSPEAFLVR